MLTTAELSNIHELIIHQLWMLYMREYNTDNYIFKLKMYSFVYNYTAVLKALS